MVSIPELLELVKDMTDDQIMKLNRGGHDPYKVYAAYSEAAENKGSPTVILAHTVKGYGLGDGGQAANDTHSVKKLDVENLRSFRDRFGIPISDEQLETVPYYRPDEDSPEMTYMKRRRDSLGGSLPARKSDFEAMKVPQLETFGKQLASSGKREISSTMAFVRMLAALSRDKEVGKRVVPIVPDEARTFGMEGMFRQMGIYSSVGQLYDPEDSNQVMYYREDKEGQMLEEGITESGAFSAWLAAATSYSVSNYPLIPFYIYYSMFGFQRVGDLCWAAGDSQARGFLIGATAGRTTLNGEGLQHQDGHSHILASTIPNCVSYDPAYAYELAVIVQDGLRRMYKDMESVFYYITTMNENYKQPELPKGAEEGIIKGMYLLEDGGGKAYKTAKPKSEQRLRLLGSGTILLEVRKAAEVLRLDYGISVDVWSVTSFNELRKEALAVTRENMLNPSKKAKIPYVTEMLLKQKGPIVSATDHMKAHSDQVREFVPETFRVLGTDGFGRSDSREQLRHFFEVDCKFIVLAALTELKEVGVVTAKQVADHMKASGIDQNKPNPLAQ